jgi:hypothetical protein
MKKRHAILWAGVTAVLVFQLGCSKQEDPAAGGDAAGSSATQAAPRSAGEPTPSVAGTAQKVVDQATAQAQALIDQTKSYLSEQNYAKAAEGLEKLSGMTLTPEQEALVAELKVEAGKVSDVVGTRLGELKALVDAKKYQEASAKLTEFTNVSLTPEQQELLDRLKAEIQKGLSSQTLESGKKAVDGLLPGN